MSSNVVSIDEWLTRSLFDSNTGPAVWDPGFDADRKAVVSRLGPYRKIFLAPPKFRPSFYHTVQPLPIENWHLPVTVELHSGFCTMEADLHLHFQATLRYAEANTDFLDSLSEHIKTGYESVIRDLVITELRGLRNGAWIKTGLHEVERAIESAVNEAMVLKYIQCRSVCTLNPTFQELPESSRLDSRFMEESVYLSILQKNFEFREKQNQELFRQEEELERQRLKHIRQESEAQRQLQSLKSENARRLLEDQGRQLQEQFEVEKHLHAEKVRHQKQLQEIEQAAEIEYKLAQQPKLQELELELQHKKIQHEKLMKEKELEAAIKAQEIFQLEWQKIQERLEEEKIKHQSRLKEMQFEAELRELERRTEASQNKDAYLRREIEWLVLDKQRAELTRAIREAERDKYDARADS